MQYIASLFQLLESQTRRKVLFTFYPSTDISTRLELQNTTNKAIQLQTHPNIDKELFKTRSVIGLKNPAKPFPVNTGVGVLKWR